MQRRTLLTGMGAALMTPLIGVTQARAEIKLGEMTVTSVSDGNLVLPGDFAFSGLPESELSEILGKYGVSRDQLLPPCNVTLLQDGDRTVLFDVGAGSGFMDSAGRLIDTLDELDLTPEDITHVVFTHAHPDHLWGVLDDFDDLLFTEAEFMIGQTEWDYWKDPTTVDTIGEARASFAVGAQRRLEAIEDRVAFVSDGQEIIPGVMAHASFGHTPGHLSFEVRSGSEAIMVIGDAIGNAHVAFERPDWPSGADQDKELGATTRQTLLDKLALENTQILGFHLPGGGLGRVERTQDAYRFVQEG